MEDPSLSYVMTTRNRLPVLRVVLFRLIDHRLDDEEIVLVDGGSTDGTVEFLAGLLKRGLIQQFSSQPDFGEAHGFNRGLLTARGRLVKLVTDDDAFYWPGLDACKRFMLCHDEIDVLGSNGGGTDWTSSDCFMPFDYGDAFRRWRDDHACFGFCGLGLMIRRASLSLLGLFNPAFVRVDMEFALRVTQGPATLAWHLGYDYMRISHSQSSAIVRNVRLADEAAYEAAHEGAQGVRPRVPDPPASQPYHQRFRSVARRLRSRLSPSVGETSRPVSRVPDTSHGADEWREVFENAEKWLAEHNARPGEFLL